ncbi:LysR family transcriptional regulator [Caballeronia grimmiae]|uniref:LysR family transcriptional regulator n=1 Tax=Caballeronia grimmiae TaxID=1071679 RepID=A0A069NDZ6_9BURK|nr:LysR family transcriptional regulator [Caballeronia grimmiae]KDR26603.1 LysR family transcriptional regulator [Caballeronia grimmiae]
MDYLTTLTVFRAVVEANSFSRAADALSLTTPVVSRAIANLEKRFDSRLLNRTTRHVSVTEAGARLFDDCCKILDDVRAMEDRASNRRNEVSGVLRLVAHTTVLMNRYASLVPSFKLAFPNIRIDVTLTERPVDLAAEGYDVAIVLPFMLLTDTAVTRRLESIPLVLVASPGYLASHPELSEPAHLVQHSFVAMSPSVRKPVLTFRVSGEAYVVQLKHDISSNSAVFNREMVTNGFGIGVLPSVLVEDEIRMGRLVRLLAGYELVDATTDVRIAYSARALLPAKVRAFAEHAVRFSSQSA